MPEMLEIEMYRRGAAPVIGRTIERVEAPDDWYLKNIDAVGVQTALTGSTIESLDRIGKLMIVETSMTTLGLRYGMTGIPLVDGEPVLAELEYSSRRLDPDWNRFSLFFAGGGSLVINDPRRLGGVELPADLSGLGPDAWSVEPDVLAGIFARYRVAAKALLLNQKRIAGLGNLLADELLWRTGVAPQRPANEVSPDAVRRIADALPSMLDELYERGGSTCGDHFPERNPDGHCPADGEPMRHDTVGGRSTWWCPAHQT